LRRRLKGHFRTGRGGALLFLLGAAAIVLLAGPRHDRDPAVIVIAVALAVGAIGAGRG